ncbi:alpha-1,2-fucosyltransferase [Spirosoma horti]
MKIVLFGGGLGNQIFEYAFYLHLKNTFPSHDIFGVYHKKWLNAHNGLELDKVFNVTLPKANIFVNIFVYLLYIHKRIFPKTTICNLNPKNDNLNALFFNAFKPDLKYYNYLNHWISFKKLNLNDTNLKLFNEIKDFNSVSIHVRRGDYYHPDNISIYGNICTKHYYEDAIKFAKSRYSSLNFYVFSDDIDWAKAHIKVENSTFIDWNIKSESYIDMYLMSHCKVNILANSTFSYWAAYLNKNTSLVIYPFSWMNPSDLKPNIFPENWIGLQSNID